MMRNRFAMIFTLLCCLTIVALLQAQSDRPLAFDLPEEAAIEHGPSGTWDGRYTDPGAVLFHDGVFHMFRNGFAAWPAPVSIAHHISSDGLAWEPVGDAPILAPEDAPFYHLAYLASSVMVEDDGTWVLYAYTWVDQQTSPGMQIIRATAPAPDGPWTFHAEPLLTAGPTGTWDEFGVTVPAVVKTDDGYLMFYSGYASEFPAQAIGMATSTDGITWTKHDNPATTDALYAESDPVFTAAHVPWDADVAHQPHVVATPDGLVMLFRTFTGRQQNIAYGLATSTDNGLTWHSSAAEPVLRWNDPTVLSQIWFSTMAYADGEYYGFFEVARGATTNIHAGKLMGAIPF